MKKLLLVLLAMLVSVFFAACNADNDVEEYDDVEEQTEDAVSSVQNDEKPAKEDKKDSSKNKEVSLETLMKAKASPESDFGYTEVDGGVSITQYIGDDAMVVIPEKIGGKKVVELDSAFMNNKTVRAVRLSDTVTVVKANTFINCPELEIFVSGKSLKTIGSFAFVGCFKLMKVVLNEGLETLGHSCFLVESLLEIDIPDSVTVFDMPFPMSNNEDRTIISGKGTAAEQFAIDNGCIFKER